ncbi:MULTISPECIES: hypothetical protein [unclassified Streptomyces]|nr:MULTISPECIES: hypothetical protein [unclassified Streptomyces]SNB83263.1 hypothetical protein SAMN02745831_02032 [Streptomyces sp. PgraA7]
MKTIEELAAPATTAAVRPIGLPTAAGRKAEPAGRARNATRGGQT